MKKVILIAALAMVSIANAQKGSFLLMGSVGFSSSKDSESSAPSPATDDEDKFNTFNFSPKLGYQFSDHMTIGIEGSVSGSKNEGTTTTPVGPGLTITVGTETKTSDFSVGPFLRYATPLSDIFSVYADLGVGFQSTKTTNEVNNGLVTTSTDVKGDGIYASIIPAVFINMKKGFGVHIGIGGIGFSTLKYDDEVDPGTGIGTVDRKENDFIFSFGQTFNVGISKNF